MHFRPNLSFNLSQIFQLNFSDIKSIKVDSNAIKIQRNTRHFRNHAPMRRNFIFFIYEQILMHFFSNVYFYKDYLWKILKSWKAVYFFLFKIFYLIYFLCYSWTTCPISLFVSLLCAEKAFYYFVFGIYQNITFKIYN